MRTYSILLKYLGFYYYLKVLVVIQYRVSDTFKAVKRIKLSSKADIYNLNFLLIYKQFKIKYYVIPKMPTKQMLIFNELYKST